MNPDINDLQRQGNLKHHSCGGSPVNGLKTFNARDLQKKEIEPIRWIIPGILPEGLAILAGKPKTGKSWLCLDLALAVATEGKAFDCIDVTRASVLYLALEDGERRLKDRIQILRPTEDGSWPDNLNFLTELRQEKEVLATLDKHLKDHPEIKLLIIDTLALLWPEVTRESKRQTLYISDYKWINSLKQIADRHKICVLCVHHLNKGEHTDKLDKVSGSSGITGAADALLTLDKDRNSDNANLFVTGRDIEERELMLGKKDNGCSWKLLGDKSEFDRSPEQAEILQYMKSVSNPVSPKQIEESTKLGNSKSISNMLQKMISDELIEKVKYGQYQIRKESSSL